ncbi:MAG: hypothetical protein WBG08_10560 [Litorimonas sp.]
MTARGPEGLGPDSEAGFVVPYVLMVVFILALIIIGTADRIRAATDRLIAIESAQTDAALLHDMKTTLTYAWLTSSPSDAGFDLNGNLSGDAALFTTLARQGEPGEVQIWSPDGSWMQSGSAWISVRDASGLFGLRAGPSGTLEEILLATTDGMTRPEARQLAARLADYQDGDDNRRLMGAEPTDYRRARKPAPANRPLRDLPELWNVLSWDDARPSLDTWSFLSLVSAGSAEAVIREAYAHPSLAQFVEASAQDNTDLFATPTSTTLPSRGLRLTLALPTDAQDARVLAVDLMREANGLERPWQSFPVFEGTVSRDLLFDGGAADAAQMPARLRELLSAETGSR